MSRVWKSVVLVAALACFLAPVAAVFAQTQVVAEERSGTILKLSGTTVIVRNDKNEIKKYTGIPAGATVTVDGKPIKFRDLREGMKYTAVRFENVPAPVVVTQAEVDAMPSAPPPPEPAPAPAPAPAAEPAPAPAEEKPATLPKTASPLPLLAALGLGLTGLGIGLRRKS